MWLGHWAAWGSCYYRAAFSSNDSKTLYRKVRWCHIDCHKITHYLIMQRCLRSDVRTNNTPMIYVLYLASHSEHAWHRRQYWWEIHVNLYFLNPWLVQGWPKRWTRGYVNLRWKSCFLLPAAGRRTQFLSLIFTEPGVHLLGHPCNTMVFLVTKPNAVIIGNYFAFNVKATSPLGGLYKCCQIS